MKKTDRPILIEETFNRSVSDVWSAITDVELMRKWFFENIPDFKPEVGFEVVFEIKNESRTFPHRWKITRVVPQKLLEYNWKYDGYSGDSNVIFELSEVGDLTILKFQTIILEDFQSDIPEFTRESCIGGWTYFLKQNLKNFLDG
ncbi:MAG: SRPBCC domain-containing protein [Melioribacteraceae bacterium]|nr:SRPBCC domain-containing protein [Melioribacteraceae bacterium]MCF8263090.1 SRPBCC domain-containing protein [Melioribacteraceae bacterium]MCF8413623.1 SRPBCC domain-containing protein [Melioribacteraceae bacterium]MCF8431364.1 SRPBCC domain-containing protein [Melioribacteraceae bacterium]